MTLTLKQKENFLRNRSKANKVIKKFVKKKNAVLFGGKSINKQVPKFLREPARDYDIFIKNPKKSARELERRLDKRFGGDFYEVERAKHKGTYKIRSRVSKKGIADLSKHPKPKPKTISKKGIKLASLEFQKKKIKESLRNPEAKFRHDKDRFTRLRIKIAELEKKKRELKRKPKQESLRVIPLKFPSKF